jgi:hypothetical protein
MFHQDTLYIMNERGQAPTVEQVQQSDEERKKK